MFKVAVIPSTTRQGRFADRVLAWFMPLASARTDATYEVVDLRDYPMPFFDEPRSPMFVTPKNDVAVRWAAKLAQYDAFIFVTAEYNHGIPAVLKNALDYAYAEFVRKPATFVAYGNAGGARAVEQLRLVLAELQVATLKHDIHINMIEMIGMLREGKTFADYPYLDAPVAKALDELSWWAGALKAART